MKKLHKTVSDQSELNQTTLSQNLEKAQLKALDDCAAALQSIVDIELALKTNQPNIGNVQLTKEAFGDEMAYLVIFDSRAFSRDRIKIILSKQA